MLLSQIILFYTYLQVTGRPEFDHQRIAPWGYGDNFDTGILEKDYPLLLQVAQRIGRHVAQQQEGMV